MSATRSKVKPLSQRDWDQLLVLASGYLTLTGGNIDLAMAKAIEAHARLIDSVKKGRITTRLGKGTMVQLVVPEEGGLALRFEVPERATPLPAPSREEQAREVQPREAAPPAPEPLTGEGKLPGVVVASLATPVALAPPPPLEPTPPMRPPPPTEDPPTFPDVSFEVFERPSSHGASAASREDAGIMDE
jgi:hypothetical protein